MKEINLLVVIFTFVFVSCKMKTGSSDTKEAAFDLNTELLKAKLNNVTSRTDAQIDSVRKTMLSNNTLAVTLGISPDNAPYLFLARTKPGDAEIHEQMDDVAIIRSGHDVLKTGHQVFGKIATEDKAPWRNWFCEGIKKPEERTIGPGDFVIIPAMTVHQYVLGPGDTLSYWTIKVKQVPNPGSN